MMDKFRVSCPGCLQSLVLCMLALLCYAPDTSAQLIIEPYFFDQLAPSAPDVESKKSADEILINDSDLFWDDQFTVAGVDGEIFAIEEDSEGNVYIGGDFASIGGLRAHNIAMWDGTNWNALGNGVNGVVHSIVTIGLEVYVGGEFSRADGINVDNVANWTKQERWRAMGTGISGPVYDMVVQGDRIVAGGKFTAAGSSSANNIARWNGSNWIPLGAGAIGGGEVVWAVGVNGEDVYIGGDFTQADGISTNNVALWRDGAWQALDAGITSTGAVSAVYAIIRADEGMWFGGEFESAGTFESANLALYDYTNSTWANITPETGIVNGTVRALEVSPNGALLIGGEFDEINGAPFKRIARRAGNTWFPLGTGVNNRVRTILAAEDTEYFVGGSFSLAGGAAAAGVARWGGTAWQALSQQNSNSVDGAVHAIAQAPNGDIIVGGDFILAGTLDAQHIALWDGSDWQTLGEGVNATVFAIEVDPDGTIYVGGDFTMAGTTTASRVAKWDGSEWTEMGTGMDNTVYDIEQADDGTLYAGGDFILAGSTTANRIARWSTSKQNWEPMLGGADNRVTSLSFSEGRLAVGGWFQNAGLVDANGIAAWEDDSWVGFEAETDGFVHDVVANGKFIYIVGDFFNVGGTPARRIACWNGRDWAGLDDGLDGTAFSITSKGDEIFVGGDFGQAGTTSANNIARWDGVRWASLGSGTNDIVNTIMLKDDYIYAGGEFSLAGNKPSYNIARWFECSPDLNLVADGSTTFCIGESLQLRATPGYVSYQWSTGESGESITVTTSGTWTVSVQDEQGCRATREITTTVNPLPEPEITIFGETTASTVIFLCPGSVVRLDGGEYNGFKWSDGSLQRSLNVNRPGDYWVEVTDFNGCSASSPTVSVVEASAPATPIITLSNDEKTLISSEAETYRWFRNGVEIPGATAREYTPVQDGNYVVRVTDNSGSGCETDSEPVAFSITTDVAIEKQAADFTLYPNPTAGKVQLRYTAKSSGLASIVISNAVGVNVAEHSLYAAAGNVGELTLTLEALPAGVYFVRLTTPGEESVRKIVKR